MNFPLSPRVVSSPEMLLTYARAFAVAAASVEHVRGQLKVQLATGNFHPFNKEMPLGTEVLKSLSMTRELCDRIPSLNPVIFEIDRLIEKLANPQLPLTIDNDLEHLQHRIHDELRGHFYYAVTAPYADVYESPSPFGEDVFNRFPSAIRDSQDASKCLALGQGTAAVFHLMRVMEVALRVLGKDLGIGYQPSWDGHLKKIADKLDEKHDKLTPSQRRKKSVYRDLHGDLTAVKLAWRNPTMHIARFYEFAEADQIYGAVRMLMQHMARHFQEKGKPITVISGPTVSGDV
jgi:hypothetical protein